MPDFQSLIKLLQNDNPNKRYEACEELRVSQQPLPQEAIDVLNLATNDSNPDVADAARRALALHTQVSNEPELRQEQDEVFTDVTSPKTNSAFYNVLVVIVSAIFSAIFCGLISFIPIGYYEARYLLLFISIPLGFFAGGTAAVLFLVKKVNNNYTFVGSILVSILTTFIAFHLGRLLYDLFPYDAVFLLVYFAAAPLIWWGIYRANIWATRKLRS